MANKKFKNKSTIDRNISRKDPLADYKASERRKKKIKDMGSFNKGGMCRGMGAAIRGGKFEGVK